MINLFELQLFIVQLVKYIQIFIKMARGLSFLSFISDTSLCIWFYRCQFLAVAKFCQFCCLLCHILFKRMFFLTSKDWSIFDWFFKCYKRDSLKSSDYYWPMARGTWPVMYYVILTWRARMLVPLQNWV